MVAQNYMLAGRTDILSHIFTFMSSTLSVTIMIHHENTIYCIQNTGKIDYDVSELRVDSMKNLSTIQYTVSSLIRYR